jgi:hypothetical protein
MCVSHFLVLRSSSSFLAEDGVYGFPHMVLREQTSTVDLDTNLTMHKYWSCGCSCEAQNILHKKEEQSYEDKGPFLTILCILSQTGSEQILLAVPRCLMMLTKTRDMLSPVLHLADTTFAPSIWLSKIELAWWHEVWWRKWYLHRWAALWFPCSTWFCETWSS